MTEFDGLPVLRSPVAIAAFEGWNDAADASTAVVEHLDLLAGIAVETLRERGVIGPEATTSSTSSANELFELWRR